jgi:hypothetical protein
MNALIVSSISNNIPGRPNKNHKTIRVSNKHKYVLSLHLSGYKTSDIKDLTGYCEGNIRKILNSEGINILRQQLMEHLDKEFQAQYFKVINAVDDGLKSAEPTTVRLQAAKLWGEYHQKFKPKTETVVNNLTAEDIVFNIMNNTTIQESTNEA